MGRLLKKISDKRAFTLVELVIVIAVIAIISAIVLPNFTGTTEKSRLKADVQSTRILQNASELYDAEQATPLARSSFATDCAELKTAGYLKNEELAVQTSGAVWKYDTAKKIKLDITACTAAVKAIAAKLSTQEKSILLGL